ncbi:MAG: methyltransferase domain-containing protein [Candidatus Aenigmarchaeota archaeon]|nr:methyltransferase domain-containing protein [Candidatus Aenigmarchaeota archaeon]
MKIKNQPPDWYFRAYQKGGFHKKRIDKIVSMVKPNSKVLDAGCGSGIIPFLLSKKNCKIVGIDKSADCIKFASKKYNGKFLCKDLLKLNLKKKFDYIICSDVIEHFKKTDRKKLLNILDRHLKKNGYIIITFPTSFYILIEPMWKRIRKLKYPNIIFDDEEIHETVEKQEIYNELENYFFQDYGLFGLIHFIKAKKVKS